MNILFGKYSELKPEYILISALIGCSLLILPIHLMSFSSTMVSFLKELGVDGYPTVLIFDKSGTAIFRGNMENASDYIGKLF
jgi:hypothetical protein